MVCRITDDFFVDTIQVAGLWLEEVRQRLGWREPARVRHVFQSVLRAIRDRLPVPEAAAFGNKLPLLLRGLFYEDWCPIPSAGNSGASIADEIAPALRQDLEANPHDVARVVLEVLAEHVDLPHRAAITQALNGQPIHGRCWFAETK